MSRTNDDAGRPGKAGTPPDPKKTHQPPKKPGDQGYQPGQHTDADLDV